MKLFKRVEKIERERARQEIAYVCDEVYLRTGLKVRDLEVRAIVQVLADMTIQDMYTIYRIVAHAGSEEKN